MTEVEARIGYAFKNGDLLLTALTHPSYGGDHHVPHYQRLEFLGDAVLGLYVGKWLYTHFPEVPEGKLTRMRADLVCEETLSAVVREMKIAGFIRLSVGEMRSGGQNKPSILCDIYESVLGAVYLDGGSAAAAQYIERTLGPRLKEDNPALEHLDCKSRLQALLQATGRMPVYELVGTEGPDHAPVFTYTVSAEGGVIGSGSGHSKQAAQAEAARDALERMGV